MQFLAGIAVKASVFLVVCMLMSSLLKSRVFRFRRTGFFVTLGVCLAIATLMTLNMANLQFDDSLFIGVTANVIAACAAALAFMIYRTMKLFA